MAGVACAERTPFKAKLVNATIDKTWMVFFTVSPPSAEATADERDRAVGGERFGLARGGGRLGQARLAEENWASNACFRVPFAALRYSPRAPPPRVGSL